MKPITLAPPKIPYDGWTIESDIGQKTIDLSSVVLHLEPEQEQGYIKGTELQKRLEGKHPLSASVLDYLIEHPEETPEQWKEKIPSGGIQFIYFFGTIYRDRYGLYVRYWFWDEGRWQSNYLWLDDFWRGFNPSALLASAQSSDTQPSSGTVPLEARVADLEAWKEHIIKAYNS